MTERPRLGVIVPSVNTVMEDDIRRFLGSDVDVSIGRVSLGNAKTPAEFAELLRTAPPEATKLQDAGVDAVLFACTAGSMVGDLERDLEELLGKAAGAPVVTTAGAIVAATRALEIRRPALATPMIQWLHDVEVDYLRDRGMDVAGVRLEIGSPETLGSVPAARVTEAVVAGVNALEVRPDAVIVSCANARAFESVSALETRLGLPVITSNQALLWAGLQVVGVPLPVLDWGALATGISPLPATHPRENS